MLHQESANPAWAGLIVKFSCDDFHINDSDVCFPNKVAESFSNRISLLIREEHWLSGI